MTCTQKWALGAEQQPVVSRALRLAFNSHYQYNDFIQLTFKMNYFDACLREVRVNHLIRLTDLISWELHEDLKAPVFFPQGNPSNVFPKGLVTNHDKQQLCKMHPNHLSNNFSSSLKIL